VVEIWQRFEQLFRWLHIALRLPWCLLIPVVSVLFLLSLMVVMVVVVVMVLLLVLLKGSCSKSVCLIDIRVHVVLHRAV
jgi:hypothetical protein